MHKREIKEAFSQLHASEELVKEVIALKSEKKNDSRVWRIVARAAVCAAVVVAIVVTAVLWDGTEPGEQMGMSTLGTTVAPTELPTTLPDVPTAPTETEGYELVKLTNVVKLYSCNAEKVSEEELKQYEVTDAVTSYQPIWLDYYPFGLDLYIQVPQEYYGDAKITFQLETAYGTFWNGEYTAETTKIQNFGYAVWEVGEDLQKLKDTFSPGAFYGKILIFADDRPVGFGLLEFSCRHAYSSLYAVHLRRFRAVCYPLVDGQFPDISEEYIRNEIAEYERVMRMEYEDVISRVDPTWKGA